MLFYGPPGNSKSTILMSLAKELLRRGHFVLKVAAADLLSKFVRPTKTGHPYVLVSILSPYSTIIWYHSP